MQNVSEWVFTGSMGTAVTDSGLDLMLTELDDRYAVEIGSRKGSKLLEELPIRETLLNENDDNMDI